MNWILLEPDEKLPEPNLYKLSGVKSDHIRSVLKRTTPGESFRAIVPGESQGRIEIVYWEGNKVVVSYAIHEEMQKKKSLRFTLASPLPRPQTGKKLFHLAGAYGIDQIVFYVHSSKSREYLTSPVYRDNGHKEFHRSGMAQTGRNAKFQFLLIQYNVLTENHFHSIPVEAPFHLIFHPYKFPSIRGYLTVLREEILQSNCKNLCIHLGSESGWTEEEIIFFQKRSDSRIYSLTGPVLRSEYALNAILHELEYIGGRD